MSGRAPFAIGLSAVILLAGTGFGLRAASQPNTDAVTIADASDVAHAPAPVESAAAIATAPATAPAPAPAESLPTPKDAPAAAVFEEMRHVWQSLNNCGPAAVVMALSTFGVSESQEVARLALRGPDVRRDRAVVRLPLHGHLQARGRAAAAGDRRQGLVRHLRASGAVRARQERGDPAEHQLRVARARRGRIRERDVRGCGRGVREGLQHWLRDRCLR